MKHLTTLCALALSLCTTLSCAQNKHEQSEQQTTTEKKQQTMEGKKVLVAFFSHTGENYAVGNIAKGNTHIVAEMIAEQTGADLFEIQPTKDYPEEYDPCTEVAKQEIDTQARPAIKGDANVEQYDVVFIGYPIWWGDAPMPVYTFIEKHAWEGKTVIPFCTHEGSGLSGSTSHIAEACKGATLGTAFELRGATAQKRQAEARKKVGQWLDDLK